MKLCWQKCHSNNTKVKTRKINKPQDYYASLWPTAKNDLTRRAIVAAMKKALSFEDYKIGNFV
jgi:hypothetical protein